MTFDEAKELMVQSDWLIGKEFKGKKIDGVVIIPNDLSNIYSLVKHSAESQNDTEGFELFDDFIVITLLGYSLFRETGHLEYEDIRTIISLGID
jgi:hypothetical protein